MKQAQDIMIRDVIAIHPDDAVRDLLLLFSSRHVSGVPVTEESGKLTGMVTVSDVVAHLQPHTVPVMSVMPSCMPVHHPQRVSTGRRGRESGTYPAMTPRFSSIR